MQSRRDTSKEDDVDETFDWEFLLLDLNLSELKHLKSKHNQMLQRKEKTMILQYLVNRKRNHPNIFNKTS